MIFWSIRSDHVKEQYEVREIDPAVSIVIECTDGFILSYPVHLIEIQHHICEITSSVAIEIFVQAIVIGICREESGIGGICVAGLVRISQWYRPDEGTRFP